MSIERAADAASCSIGDKVLGALPDALLLLGDDLAIVHSNDQFRTLFGLPIYAARPGALLLDVADQIDFDAAVALNATARHPLRARWQRMFADAESMDHVEILSDGRSVLMRYRPLAEGGALVLFSDITDGARREADQSALVREHHQVLTELSEVTLGLTRALDSPLRAITDCIGWLDTKHATSLADGARVYLDRMAKASDLMRSVLRDFRGYADLASGEGAREEVDLEEVVREVLAIMQRQITDTAAHVEYDSLPSVPGDRALLTLLFEHVIDNALKFRRPDAEPSIKIAYKSQAGVAGQREAVITVADNGLGFDPAHAEAVFGIFRSIGPEDDGPRNGFGLAACHKIARLHGGAISAETERDVGTTIKLVLPAEKTGARRNEAGDDAALLGKGGTTS